MSIASVLKSHQSDYGLEYSVVDLYSQLETKYTLDQIMDKMIEEDFIGKRMDYIPVSCIPEFVKIATTRD